MIAPKEQPGINIQKQVAAWALRLFFAALLLTNLDLLLWLDGSTREPLEWLITIIGTIALSTLTLDLAVRYRIRDTYDSMALIAIFALLYGLLITPHIAYEDFPFTLVTRVLGAQALTALVAFGIFLVLLRGNDNRTRRLIIPAAIWLGFYRGVWLRWVPEFSDLFEPVSLETMLLSIPPYLFVCLALFAVVLKFTQNRQAEDLKLAPIEGLALLLVPLIIFIVRVAQGQIPPVAAIASGVIIFVCIGVLYFRHNKKNVMLMSAHIPPQPLSPLWIIIMIVVFIGASVFSYSLPLVGNADVNQLRLMEIGFSAVGVLWMPFVGTVVAFRGIDRQMRQRQLNI